MLPISHMKAAHWKKDSSMNGVLLKLISEGEIRISKKWDKRCVENKLA